MVVYKLHYFAGRGAAEVTRQLFKLANQPFEDIRYTPEEFAAVKADMPFGQLPVLEVDGKFIPQSYAIARYVAKLFGFNGKDDFEAAQVSAFADQWKDYINEIRPYLFILRGHAQGDLEKSKEETLVPASLKHLEFFENTLKNNESGFYVGAHFTWVDIMSAEFIVMLQDLDADLAAKFPTLLAHTKKMHEIPRIKTWRETRPVTQF